MNQHQQSTGENRSGVYHHFNRTPLNKKMKKKKDSCRIEDNNSSLLQARGQTQLAESNTLAPGSEINQWRASPRMPLMEGLATTQMNS